MKKITKTKTIKDMSLEDQLIRMTVQRDLLVMLLNNLIGELQSNADDSDLDCYGVFTKLEETLHPELFSELKEYIEAKTITEDRLALYDKDSTNIVKTDYAMEGYNCVSRDFDEPWPILPHQEKVRSQVEKFLQKSK